ncbi:PTS transporter subunit EIIC [Cellulomonas carbonis]|uniref:PTS N-acetylglucosamine transporter subunit IIBC n=1 Tax=Cellulomonas carbonis T26 TaxID=947969 RepID=A0A0A0BPM5_9CELL|nr:PTS transporter subunit EIIC [Cellulomonas carbonis]KGM10433.1 PTS N-acetylglucosamine transporter subunit IIBC [Cellulomonas carbonis T26]GGC13577.1 PTS glucose transporter subunit IIBC [Cellulomonas carbonis]
MTATTAPVAREKRAFPGLAQLQRIGRSLMLPIASLPAAALLLRLGQPDMLGADGLAGAWGDWLLPVAAVLGAAGNALFGNLPLIFALGVAIGYARKSDGSTGLAALIGYLVFKGVSDALSPYFLGEAAEGETQELINYGVLGGIVMGLIAALLYQRYYRIKLPAYLAFFGGRRFVPIVTAFVAIFVALIGAVIYPAFDAVLTGVSDWVTGSAVLGGFVFGTLNRLLVPIGLHHLLNSVPWFQFGEYVADDGTVANGDIFRFLAGDPTAGIFQAGFFPIMMFALPAAALAMVHTAKPEKRKVITGIMGSAALVSFVTGVTEPLEFAFVYVAYPLYVIHAVLTGTSLALVNALDVRSGFGFSAGVIDYLLNFRIAEQPLLLVVIGLGYAVLYYVLFRFVITKWNLRTPGREDDDAVGDANNVLVDQPDDTERTPARTRAGTDGGASTARPATGGTGSTA